MNRSTTRGIMAAGILGVAAYMYTATTMTPRQRKRMMKNGKRALSALSVMKGMNMF